MRVEQASVCDERASAGTTHPQNGHSAKETNSMDIGGAAEMWGGKDSVACAAAGRGMRAAYREAVARYTDVYGERTMVAMMSGSMYCFYDEQARVSSEVAGLRSCAADSTGFPCQSLAYWGGKFTDAGYVLVVMDQFSRRRKNGGEELYREAVAVYGPGNPVDAMQGGESRLCAVVYLDDARHSAGYATFDSSTGATRACEYGGATFDSLFGALVGAATADGPAHTLVVYADGAGGEAAAARFRASASGAFGVRVDYRAVDRVTLRESHVRETIRSAFGGCGLLSHASEEYVGLGGRPNAARAFSHLVHFVYRRGDGGLSLLSPPEVISPEGHLEVAVGGLRQLDITGDEGLLRRLPQCCTAAGRREFRRRLCRPCRDPSEMKRRLDLVDSVACVLGDVRGVLSGGLVDMEACLRSMERPSTVRLSALRRMARSLDAAATACELAGRGVGCGGAGGAARRASACIGRLVSAEGESCDDGRIMPGVDARYDAAAESLSGVLTAVGVLVDYLNECSGSTCGERHFRLCEIGGGCDIVVTQRRFDVAMGRAMREARVVMVGGSAVRTADIGIRPHRTRRSERVIFGGGVDEALDELAGARAELDAATRAAVAAVCAEIVSSAGGDVIRACRELEDVDVAAACAACAAERGFVRPVITDGPGGSVRARGLRHPIVEAMDTMHEYVGNDVSLGDGGLGLLVFGINGSGKSCLMKSIGIAVCMAQAGMFVAADSLEISPFARLFTRIWNNDDIARGMSTFAVEMTELADALRRADGLSLVLGDELCSGTERVSATAIISAAVEHFVARGCRFVLATHQHDVASTVACPDLRVVHMGVRTVDGEIVYDRELREGCGGTDYGVTVCRALGLPADFVQAATRHVRVMRGQDPDFLVPRKASRYNRSVFMGACAVCESRQAEHTHHVVPQATAPARVRDAAHNLVALCSKCHVDHHRKERASPAAPSRAVQTSSGVVRVPIDIS